MPINPQELIVLARYLVDRNPGAPVEGDLRRAVSTAYYAVFHLLINGAMDNIVIDPVFRTRVGRAIQHGSSKSLCEQYRSQKSLLPQLQNIVNTFISLQQSREEADYDGGVTLTYADANKSVQSTEQAFTDWISIQSDSSVLKFLQDLFCKSIIKK